MRQFIKWLTQLICLRPVIIVPLSLSFSLSIDMSFQRSYSKVWWGSDNQQNGSSFTSGGFYSQYNLGYQLQQQQHQPASLDSALQRQQHHQQAGNLSSIQEVEDEQNSSKLSWHKHDSPGSLRSQVCYLSNILWTNLISLALSWLWLCPTGTVESGTIVETRWI